jgi:hypothetical protein
MPDPLRASTSSSATSKPGDKPYAAPAGLHAGEIGIDGKRAGLRLDP